MSIRVNDKTMTHIQGLLCSICLDILCEPVTCQTCQAIFCKKCVDGWLENYTLTCPMLCEKYMPGSCPEAVIKNLSQLQVSCSFSPRGCKNVIHHLLCSFINQ